MTPNSNDFVMLIAGDDLGEEVLSKHFLRVMKCHTLVIFTI